uniref:CCHC-type domain-containing protein n=1 Tax=Cannabis sativa TaxID=3483 RepID=A0A803Q778_CANSA
MDPFIHKMKSTMTLSDNEKSVFAIADDGSCEGQPPEEFSLFARVITHKKVWLTTFQRQMAEHWDGQFKVNIKEHFSGLFILCFGCEGDRLRALDKEPWHFQNHHIVLYPPTALQNVTPESMVFSPFWVQPYRLPFLSKSRLLAKSLGNLLGEFLTVHEDSLNEGWGPFLQFKVRLNIMKPLLRGKMITLPKVWDEFWVEFCYERLPDYCMECGIIGHLYQKCPKFLENLDNGIEPELAYGPMMNGSALPSSSYDRYRSDFSKGNAWPLLTRLARNSLTATIPRIHSRPPPHPTQLLTGESSTSQAIPSATATATDHVSTTAPSSRVQSFFSPALLGQSSLISSGLVQTSATQSPFTSGLKSPIINASTTNNSVVHLSNVYTPDVGYLFAPSSVSTFNHPIAIYP